MYEVLSNLFGILGFITGISSLYVGASFLPHNGTACGLAILLCLAVSGLLLVGCAWCERKQQEEEYANTYSRCGCAQCVAASNSGTSPAKTLPARPSAPGINRSEVDSLKAKLQSFVDERDAALEEIASSNRPETVKSEEAHAVLANYKTKIASL